MKKFISALTSLAIATTALGGTIVLSADAADKTIIEFQSNGKNSIEAKAGDTVPVTVYVPQCAGVNTLSLKMSINGTKTLGVGVEETAEELAKIKNEAEKTEDAQAKADYLAVEHWLYGNYGIKTANEKYAMPFCFDSGMYQDGAGCGDPELSMAYFLPNMWNISLTLKSFASKSENADSFAAFAKSQGIDKILTADDEDELWDLASFKFKGSDYKPTTTWTKDDAFAYDYALATFDLVLPSDLPDGTYTLDVLREKYINVVSHQWAQSSVSGKDGKAEFDTVPLKITVGKGGEPEETTTTPAVTTTAPDTTKAPTESTTAQGTTAQNVDKPEPKAGTVQYDLIADGKECGFDGTNNTVTVEPGEEVKVNWIVKNDPGTAGMQMHFDFPSAITGIERSAGRAYKASVEWNETTYAYVWASDKALTAKDDSVVSSFSFKAPEKEGTYIITTKETDGPIIIRPLEDSEPNIPYTFYGLAITVGNGGGGETTKAVTTTAPDTTKAPTESTTAQGTTAQNVDKPAPKAGTVQYDLIADGIENGFNGTNNTATVKPGEEVKVNWVVKNDPGTAGMQMHFDFPSAITGIERSAGRAYKASVEWNETTYAYVWASDKALTAKDDSVVSSFTFKAPTEKGTYIITTKETDGPIIIRPLEDSEPNIPYVFYGLALTVDDAPSVTTGESTTTPAETTTTSVETTVTTSEVTNGTTIETTTTPGGSTTAPVSETTTTSAVKYGDVNVDGDVRINDVVMLSRYIAGTITVSPQGLKNADCNKDGSQDAKDVSLIMKFLAKLRNTPEEV